MHASGIARARTRASAGTRRRWRQTLKRRCGGSYEGGLDRGEPGALSQAAIQGAFILAKAQHGVVIAGQCIDHLRRYMELLFKEPHLQNC